MAMKFSWLGSRKQAVYAAEGGAKEVTWAPWESPEIMRESQIMNIELFAFLEHDFAVCWLRLCPMSSLLN